MPGEAYVAQERRALDVAEERMAEAAVGMRAVDEARDVGNGESLLRVCPPRATAWRHATLS